MDAVNEPPPDADPWHAALAAAFGAPVDIGAEEPSVLARLESVGGPSAPRLLKEPGHGADTGPVPRSTKQPIPSLPSRYRVLGEIGRGGMGIVWRVHDVELGRDVAIKVLRDEWTLRPERVRRFIEEAQITGQLEHPGVVPLHEIGADPGRRPWFAMRLVRGETLWKRLSRRAKGESLVAVLLPAFETICQTLAYAHARGVVHRDVKPSNVILGAFGEVQVLDWGLAAVLTPVGGDASVPGTVVGTPGYMAPEQARGESDGVDERADVFALGAILCEILTGASAFPGERDGALAATARGDLAPAVARLDACVAERELASLAKRCLEPVPSARPRDAAEVALLITAHRATLDERARAAVAETAAARVRADAERRSRRLVVGFSIAGAAVVVAGVLTWAGLERARGGRAESVATRVDRAIRDVDEALARADVTAGVDASKRARAIAESQDASAAVLARAVAAEGRAIDATEVATRAIERRRKDADVVAKIEAAREEVVALSEGWYPYWSGRGGLLPKRIEVLLSDAFHAYGIDVRSLPVADAARAIRASDVREELVAAIDLWAYVVEGFDRRDPHLDAICREVDVDPARGRLRDDADLDAVRREAGAFDAAVGTSADANLIAAFLHYYVPGPERLDFLRRVCLRRPDDYLSTFRLGLAEGADGLRGVVRASRLFAAATALRPRSAVARAYLGLSLRLVGDPGARDELARALLVDPGCWEAHAATLDLDAHEGDFEACLRHVESMERARPSTPDDLVRAVDAAAALGRFDAAASLMARAEAGPVENTSVTLRSRRDWLGARTRLLGVGRRVAAGDASPATTDDLLGAAWLSFAVSTRASSDLYERAFTADPSIGAHELSGAGVESTLVRAAEAALRTAVSADLPEELRAFYRERGRGCLFRAMAGSGAAIAADPGYAPIATVDFWSAARRRPSWSLLDDAVARSRLPTAEREAWAGLSAGLDDLLARCRR